MERQKEISDLSTRSKFFFNNTMLCLLKALEGRRITVEIRNDCAVQGKLLFVDATMGLNMDKVMMTDVKKKEMRLDQFYIQGRMIRYIQIPDDVDIMNTMKWQLSKISVMQDIEKKERSRLFKQKMDRKAFGQSNPKQKRRQQQQYQPSDNNNQQPQQHRGIEYQQQHGRRDHQQQSHDHHKKHDHNHDTQHRASSTPSLQPTASTAPKRR